MSDLAAPMRAEDRPCFYEGDPTFRRLDGAARRQSLNRPKETVEHLPGAALLRKDYIPQRLSRCAKTNMGMLQSNEAEGINQEDLKQRVRLHATTVVPANAGGFCRGF